mgnify:FL=1
MRAEAGLPLRTFYNKNNPATQLLQHFEFNIGNVTHRRFLPYSLFMKEKVYPMPYHYYKRP